VTRRTVARPAECSGTGLHSGAACQVRLGPAAPGSGIVFLSDGQAIPARVESVTASERRTALGAGTRRLDTVEHLLAAVFAIGIDDLMVQVEGPEIPILDGSFSPFVALLDAAGIVCQAGAIEVATLQRPIEITEGQASYRVTPADAYEIAVRLEYDAPVIGRQEHRCTVSEASFRGEIAAARTYGFRAEVDVMRGRGLLGGATPDCAVVLSEEAVLNTTLRWPNEFARHKLGDLIGDLALLGTRLAMRVEASRPSHRGNIACARAIASEARYLEA
jgi:UDP-3-O-acyl N-acetylglucosamine deacetylase